MSRFSVKKKGIATITIKCKEPAVNGYKTQTFSADIKKLYGDEKDQFMQTIGTRKAVDVCRQLVTKIDKIGWFIEEDGQPVVTLKDADLAEFFDDMDAEMVDYVIQPLSAECIKVQDESTRQMLEAKN